MYCFLFQRNLGVLDSQWQAFLRKVEHVEYDWLGASVLAVVDGVHHLNNSLAFMHGSCPMMVSSPCISTP